MPLSLCQTTSLLCGNQEEPKTTLDDILKEIAKINQLDDNQHLYNRIAETEREAGAAIRILCEKIDALEKKVSELSKGSLVLTEKPLQ